MEPAKFISKYREQRTSLVETRYELERCSWGWRTVRARVHTPCWQHCHFYPCGGFFSVYAECLEAVLGFIFYFRPQLLAVTPDADTNTDIWNTKQIQRVSLWSTHSGHSWDECALVSAGARFLIKQQFIVFTSLITLVKISFLILKFLTC